VPKIPRAQQPNVPPPRGPFDASTMPSGRPQRAPARRDQPPAEVARPHRRQDRGDGDDDGDAQRVLPVFVRFRDLVESGLVGNWTTLRRLIDDEGFPPGVLLSPNKRLWLLTEIEQWLAERPSGRKPIPPAARHPRVLRKRERDAASAAR
jgi:hypothetical protein